MTDLHAQVVELEGRLEDVARVAQALRNVANIRRREQDQRVASLERQLANAIEALRLLIDSNRIVVQYTRRRCLRVALTYRRKFWMQRRAFAATLRLFEEQGG